MGDLIPFDAGRAPAVMANRQSSSLAAAQQGVQASFAVVGYKGRNWRLKYRGDEELLKGQDGTPLPHLDVVVVGVSAAISKQYYDKRYTEGSDEAPDCFSIDGIAPDVSSQKKQHAVCATCPKNVWGSRITDDGKKGKACQDARRLAIVPLGDIPNESFGGPMLLRLPPMSLTNFANYAALLQRKGVPALEYVATRLGFDYDVAYPRLTFTALGWLSEEQAVEVVGEDGQGGMCADPLIDRMLQEAVAETTEPQDEAGALDQGGPPQVLQQRAAAAQAAAPAAEVAASLPAAPPQQPEAAPAPRRRAATAFSAGAPATGSSPTPAAPTAPQPAPESAASNGATALQPTQGNGSEPARQPAKPPTSVPLAPEDMNAAIDELLTAPA